MRTSLNNTKAIDDYLLGNIDPGDKLLFDANMLLNSDLKEDVGHQQNTYAIIAQYSRKQMKAEIAAVQQILATAPKYHSFMQRVTNLFKKH